METIWGWELLCVVRTVYGSFFFSPRIVFPFSPGTTLCSQDRIRTCTIEKTNFTRFFGMVNIFNVMSHGPINQSPITRLPFRHLTILRLRTPLCCRKSVFILCSSQLFTIPLSPGTTHFTSTEFFGYTSKFCNFCILLMGVLFWSSTLRPNTLEIQTLTKSLCNLLNKLPSSISFCLCLHS